MQTTNQPNSVIASLLLDAAALIVLFLIISFTFIQPGFAQKSIFQSLRKLEQAQIEKTGASLTGILKGLR